MCVTVPNFMPIGQTVADRPYTRFSIFQDGRPSAILDLLQDYFGPPTKSIWWSFSALETILCLMCYTSVLSNSNSDSWSQCSKRGWNRSVVSIICKFICGNWITGFRVLIFPVLLLSIRIPGRPTVLHCDLRLRYSVVYRIDTSLEPVSTAN